MWLGIEGNIKGSDCNLTDKTKAYIHPDDLPDIIGVKSDSAPAEEVSRPTRAPPSVYIAGAFVPLTWVVVKVN